MDIMRAILMGLGCFGLLVVGSCTMLGYGTVALVEKAAEVAKAEQNNPERKAAREARAAELNNEIAERMADQESYGSGYGESISQNTSDLTEPSLELEE